MLLRFVRNNEAFLMSSLKIGFLSTEKSDYSSWDIMGGEKKLDQLGLLIPCLCIQISISVPWTNK